MRESDGMFDSLDFIFVNKSLHSSKKFDSYLQELEYLPYLQFYTVLALNMLDDKQNCVIKLFNVSLNKTIVYIYILYKCFNTVYVTKP